MAGNSIQGLHNVGSRMGEFRLLYLLCMLRLPVPLHSLQGGRYPLLQVTVHARVDATSGRPHTMQGSGVSACFLRCYLIYTLVHSGAQSLPQLAHPITRPCARPCLEHTVHHNTANYNASVPADPLSVIDPPAAGTVASWRGTPDVHYLVTSECLRLPACALTHLPHNTASR
jgi:hypothetical protein